MLRTTAIGMVFGVAFGGAAAAQDSVASEGGAAGAPLDAALAAAPLLAGEVGARRVEPRPPEFQTALAGLSGDELAAISGFYAARDHAPFWTADDRAGLLLDALADAGRHGLPEGRYRTAEIGALAEGPDVAAAEVALTRVYLRYARDMTGGVLDPRSVDDEINLTPERPSAATLLARLAELPLAEALASLEPSSPDYAVLLAEKERLEAVARDGGWGEPVPSGTVLRLGDEDVAVALLDARLAALGYGPEEATAAQAARGGDAEGFVPAGAGVPAGGSSGPPVFDAALEARLMAFQADAGLVDDGILGRETLAALNASPEERIGQILVNLERLRWLPEDMGARHVLVNIPDYTVSVIEDGARVYHTRSVVGEQKTQTPEFSDKMTYLVVNPTWYIPDSIAKRVYLPKLRQDPSVLRNNNMRLFTRSGTEIDPGLVNFAELGDSFPFRVRQNPSASNALGRVKFMFPNQFAIYLHDTPNRELFDRDARAFSNGCVRLEKPFELAHYLLAPQLDDPEGQFQAWVEVGSERYVTLEEPIDVHIVYRTAFAEEGDVRFRRDVYGRDARVLEALTAAGVAPPVRETAAADSGRAG